MNPEELAAIRERLEIATKGNWQYYPTDSYGGWYEIYVNDTRICTGVDGTDIEFITNAPTDITTLLTEVDRLQSEVAYLRQSSCQGGRDFNRPRPIKPGDPIEPDDTEEV